MSEQRFLKSTRNKQINNTVPSNPALLVLLFCALELQKHSQTYSEPESHLLLRLVRDREGHVWMIYSEVLSSAAADHYKAQKLHCPRQRTDCALRNGAPALVVGVLLKLVLLALKLLSGVRPLVMLPCKY